MKFYTEVFDNPYDYRFVGGVPSYLAYFTPDEERRVQVDINILRPEVVTFQTNGLPVAYATFNSESGKSNSSLGDLISYFSTLFKNKYGLTGEGDAFRILATVIRILSDYMEDHQEVKYLLFDVDSSDSSRINLYNRLAQSKYTRRYDVYFGKVQSRKVYILAR